MTPATPSGESLQVHTGLSGVIRRNVGVWSRLLQPVSREAPPRIDGLEVTESTLEEWMAVEQQFDARLRRR